MTTATANLLTRIANARIRYNIHFDHCRNCGTRFYCVAGDHLHTTYTTLLNSINR